MASDDISGGGGGFYDLRWTRRKEEPSNPINWAGLGTGSQGTAPIYDDNPINPVETEQEPVATQDTQVEKPKPEPTPEPEPTLNEQTYVNQQEEVKAPEPEPVITPVADQGRGVDKAFSSKVEEEEDDDGWFYMQYPKQDEETTEKKPAKGGNLEPLPGRPGKVVENPEWFLPKTQPQTNQQNQIDNALNYMQTELGIPIYGEPTEADIAYAQQLITDGVVPETGEQTQNWNLGWEGIDELFSEGGNPLREEIDRLNSGNLRATDVTHGRPVDITPQTTLGREDVDPTLQFASPANTYEDLYYMFYDLARENGVNPQQAAAYADENAKEEIENPTKIDFKPTESLSFGEILNSLRSQYPLDDIYQIYDYIKNRGSNDTVNRFIDMATGLGRGNPVNDTVAGSTYETVKPVAQGLWNSLSTFADPEGELSPISEKSYVPAEERPDIPGPQAGIELAKSQAALDNALEAGVLPEEAEQIAAGNITSPEQAIKRAEDLDATWGIAPKTEIPEPMVEAPDPNPVNPMKPAPEHRMSYLDMEREWFGKEPLLQGANSAPWYDYEKWFDTLPATMSFDEKIAYVNNLFRQGKDVWNYRDARDGALPDSWAVPDIWYDSEERKHFNPALEKILESWNDKSLWDTVTRDGKTYMMSPMEASDKVLSLWIKPGDYHEPGDAWRGLDNVPEECLAILASDPRAGAWFSDEDNPSNFGYYTKKAEYFNGTQEEYNRLADLFIDSVPALKTLIAYGILTHEDVARFFFKAPKTNKPKTGNGYGAGYGRYYGGGGGYYRGGGGSYPRGGTSTPSAKTQADRRVNNIMKNWSF